MTTRQQLVSRGVSCAFALFGSAFAADELRDEGSGNDWTRSSFDRVPVQAGLARHTGGNLVTNSAGIGGKISTITQDILAEGVWLLDYNDAAPGSNGGGDLQTPGAGYGYITLTAVPEPAAVLIGSLGLLALVRRRRG